MDETFEAVATVPINNLGAVVDVPVAWVEFSDEQLHEIAESIPDLMNDAMAALTEAVMSGQGVISLIRSIAFLAADLELLKLSVANQGVGVVEISDLL